MCMYVSMCAKVNAKLKSMEDECESLRRALTVEVDGRRELEGVLTHRYMFCRYIVIIIRPFCPLSTFVCIETCPPQTYRSVLRNIIRLHGIYLG